VVTKFTMIARTASVLMVANSAAVPLMEAHLLTCSAAFIAMISGGTVATFGSLHHTVSITLLSSYSSSSSSSSSSCCCSSGTSARVVTVFMMVVRQ
jgi:hypothetical protein